MFRLIVLMLLLIACTCFGRGDAADCHQKYKLAAANHSRCINGSDDAIEKPPNAAEIVEILTEHNRIRAAVNASNMRKMVWNADIATSAQMRVATCVFKHEANHERREPGKFSVGQNIGSKYGMQNYAEVIASWEKEITDFNADRTYSSAAGHYSAMVWAETSMVGCGRAQCPFWYQSNWYNMDYVFCNYAPAGNYRNVEAYSVEGEVCSQCGSANCDNNLCDCGSNNAINGCYNDGTLNLQTCQCSCMLPTVYNGTLCELENCPTSDPYGGCADDLSYCDRFSNWPVICPVTCNTCPYAAQ